MSGIELLPPKLKIDINTQIRLRVLAGVLFELTEICGVHIEDDLSKGVVERDIIEKITLYFKDANDKSHGVIYFFIDWEMFEILVQTDDSTELYKDIDFSNGYCNILDPKLLKVIKKHVAELRKNYEINRVECTFGYRSKYTETNEIHDETRKYMGHIKGKSKISVEDKQFSQSLEVVFKGMNGILHVGFEND